MNNWKTFLNRIGVTHEAFQPNHEQRERDVAEAAGLASVPRPDGNARELDSASAEEGKARATARVFLIPSAPFEKISMTVLGLALHGYTMKHHGWVVEMVRSYE